MFCSFADRPSRDSLPQLYVRQANGTNRLVDKPYSEYDLGTVFSQYLSNITDISSWSGWPPALECGPQILLGPPDCDVSDRLSNPRATQLFFIPYLIYTVPHALSVLWRLRPNAPRLEFKYLNRPTTWYLAFY